MAPVLTKSGFRNRTIKESSESITQYKNITSSSSLDDDLEIIADTVREEECDFTGGSRIMNMSSSTITDITDVKNIREESYGQVGSLFGLMEEIPGIEPFKTRETEMEWISLHYDELKAYQGQWIVVEGKRLIAHDFDFAKVVSQARAQGVGIPYVTRVVVEKEIPFAG
jgi:hypothetical protein